MRSGARTATLTSRANTIASSRENWRRLCIAGSEVSEIYVSGHSELSSSLLTRRERVGYASLIRRSSPIARAPRAALEFSVAVSVARPTREEAIEVLESLLPEDMKESTTSLKDDSQMYQEGSRLGNDSHWLNRSLWTGLVPHYGPVWTTLLGSPQELAKMFLEYERIGVTEFIMSGWPEVDTVNAFGREALPLIRPR